MNDMHSKIASMNLPDQLQEMHATMTHRHCQPFERDGHALRISRATLTTATIRIAEASKNVQSLMVRTMDL